MDDLEKTIKKFLIECKEIVVERGLDLIPRRENLETLSELGLTKKNCIEEILSLSVEDYCSGPEPDKDRPGDVWMFGKQIDGISVYIKLKVAEVGKAKITKCISFHAAKFPLCYPCKERGE